MFFWYFTVASSYLLENFASVPFTHQWTLRISYASKIRISDNAPYVSSKYLQQYPPPNQQQQQRLTSTTVVETVPQTGKQGYVYNTTSTNSSNLDSITSTVRSPERTCQSWTTCPHSAMPESSTLLKQALTPNRASRLPSVRESGPRRGVPF